MKQPIFFERNRVGRVYTGENCLRDFSVTSRWTDFYRKNGSHQQ